MLCHFMKDNDVTTLENVTFEVNKMIGRGLSGQV
jgi:hypothetical protein